MNYLNIFQSIKRIKILINVVLMGLVIKLFLFNNIIKVGIIGLPHSQNVGNNLLKYAIYTKIKELGFSPYIIGMKYNNDNISFLNSTMRIRIIEKNFFEIKKNDYDILMVNSDQTWRRFCTRFFYDVAFLDFAKYWKKPKFVYGASLGVDTWKYTNREEIRIKKLLKKFSGLSVREKGSVKLIEKHLGMKPMFVLDPTLLIDKKYYLKLIKNFKIDNLVDNNFIFIYKISNDIKLNNFIKNNIENNYKYFLIDLNDFNLNPIEKFIYGIYKSKAIITDSYHGTIFSIIFDKPFISFVMKERGIERFNSLKEVFNISNRIFDCDSNPDLKLLETPLNLTKSYYQYLKKQSINYLKSNLNAKKNFI